MRAASAGTGRGRKRPGRFVAASDAGRMPRAALALAALSCAALAAAAPRVESAFTTTARPGQSTFRAAALFPPRNLTSPAISGTAREGQTLTATNGTWARTVDSTTGTWLRDGTPVGTGTTYALTSADVGHTLVYRVTATNAAGSTSASSQPTSTVQMAAPKSTAPPTIAGSLAVGDVLTATKGTWTGSPTSYAYRWIRCTGATCGPIPGGDEPEHLITGEDAGAMLRVEVTATNAGGSATEQSHGTAAIARASFTQILCRNPDDGTLAGADGQLPDGVTFGRNVTQFPDPSAATRCASGTSGVPLSTGSPWTVSTPDQGGWLQYRASADLDFAGATVYRFGAMGGLFSWSINTSATINWIFAGPRAELCSWGDLCSTRGSTATPFGATNRVDVARGDVNGFNVVLLCDIPAGRTCTSDGTQIVRLYGGKVTLRDTASPTVATSPTGGLVTHPTLQPTEDIALAAADSGGGLYRVRVRIGSTDVAAKTLTANGGRCQDVNPGNGDPYEFAVRQPCPSSASATLQFDTAGWPKTGRLRVLLEDAGRNTTVLVNRLLG
ncbi:MAG TPA: hypothetical protein VF529_19640 [Solirubrobacteraceae bacterium]